MPKSASLNGRDAEGTTTRPGEQIAAGRSVASFDNLAHEQWAWSHWWIKPQAGYNHHIEPGEGQCSMADIKKSARAAALEATGLAGKIDELRREFGAAIGRCEDRMRDELHGMRDEIGGLRNEIGGIRNEIGGLRDEVGGIRNDVHGKSDDIRGIRDEIAALRQETANDRQQMLQMLSRFMSREAPLAVREQGPAPNP